MTRYSYLGPAGTFTEAALRKISTPQDELIPYGNVTAAFNAVRNGEVDYTNNQEVCMNKNINGYPSIILFKNVQRWKEYNQQRSINNFINFIELSLHDEL